MPAGARAAARTFLLVTAVRSERLSSIRPAEARAEGIVDDVAGDEALRHAFFSLWDRIYGTTVHSAAHDPWVWVIDFCVDRGQAVTDPSITPDAV